MSSTESRKPKVLILSPYSFIPPKHGGHQRSYNLYALPYKNIDTTIVSLHWSGSYRVIRSNGSTKIAQYVEYPADQVALQTAITFNSELKSNSWDLLIPLCAPKLKNIKILISTLQRESDAILLSHPWMIPLVGETDIPIFLDCHNIEQFSFAQFYGYESVDYEIAKLTEDAALKRSQAIFTCTELDAQNLRNLGISKPIFVIPNGTPPLSESLLRSSKKSKNFIFVGSGHYPNIKAAENIIGMAEKVKNIKFEIVGSVCDSLKRKIPENVKLHGEVSEDRLYALLSMAWAFLNPVEQGTGSHLKTVQALNFGLPLISSRVGARGLPESNAIRLCEETQEYLNELEFMVTTRSYRDLQNAARNIAKEYHWPKIRRNFEASILEEISPTLRTKSKFIKDNQSEPLNLQPEPFDVNFHFLYFAFRKILLPVYKHLPFEFRSRVHKYLIQKFLIRRHSAWDFKSAREAMKVRLQA